MFISRLPLAVTLLLLSGCDAFVPRASNIKHSIQGSTSQLFASKDSQDVVIVGAGIAGLSLAHYLKMNDAENKLSVTLLDKLDADEKLEIRDRGPCTACSLGYISVQMGDGDSKPLLDLKHGGTAMYRNWLNEVGYTLPVNEDGNTILPITGAQYSKTNNARYNDHRKSVGELQKEEPMLSGDIGSWIYIPERGRIDITTLLRDLKQSCEDKGVQTRFGEGYAVESLEMSDQTCTGVKLANGDKLPGTVVIANGADLSKLTKDLDIVPVEPAESYGCVMEPTEGKPILKKNDRVISCDVYIVPNDDGTVRVGDAGAYKLDGNTVNKEKTLEEAKKLVPAVDGLKIKDEFTAIRAYTEDGKMILGTSETVGNLYFAGGTNAYGLTAAPKVAELVGKLILGNSDGLTQTDWKILKECSPDREISTAGLLDYTTSDGEPVKISCCI